MFILITSFFKNKDTDLFMWNILICKYSDIWYTSNILSIYIYISTVCNWLSIQWILLIPKNIGFF